MKKILTLAIAALFVALPLGAKAEESEALDAGSMIIGHVTDAHSWHLFDYIGSDGQEHAVAIPLPIILIVAAALIAAGVILALVLKKKKK